jgi:hypothetical protein
MTLYLVLDIARVNMNIKKIEVLHKQCCGLLKKLQFPFRLLTSYGLVPVSYL